MHLFFTLQTNVKMIVHVIVFYHNQNQTTQVGNCSLTYNAQNITLTFKTIQSCNWQLVSISHYLFFSVDTNTFLSYQNITLKNVILIIRPENINYDIYRR